MNMDRDYIYHGVSGLYHPSFFQMEIDHEASLEKLSELPDPILETYLHEYVHFLQNISTTFGLTNACYVVEFMKYAAKEIKFTYGEEFPIPLPLKQEQEHKVFENEKLMRAYSGTSRMPDENLWIKVVNQIDRSKEKYSVGAGVEVDIPKITVHYLDSENKDREFVFGATCIIENMAFLIERMSIKQHKQLADIPYHAAELIAYHFYPEFAKEPLNVLALCDASLFSFHPADLFVNTLKYMFEKHWLPEKPMDVYDLCKKFLKVDYQGATDIFELYAVQKDAAIRELQSYFTNDEFKDNKKWIEVVLNKAFELRVKWPSFMLDLAVSGPPKQNKVFATLIHDIGTPQVTNLLGADYFYHPDIASHDFRPYAFVAISQIFKILNREQTGCGIRHSCQLNAESQGMQDYTDDRCNRPWERSNDKLLCPFAQIWKMWELTGKRPNFGNAIGNFY